MNRFSNIGPLLVLLCALFFAGCANQNKKFSTDIIEPKPYIEINNTNKAASYAADDLSIYDWKSLPDIKYFAVFLALIGAIIGFKNYRRKSGLYLVGTFSFTTTSRSNDYYLDHIVIENLKDRAVSIYAIYIKFGRDIYILVEDFKDHPLILKSYEAFQKSYGPIRAYFCNREPVKIDHLINDITIKKQIVLSTGQGKYVIPNPVKLWNPRSESKRVNALVVEPIIKKFKDQTVGANTDYVIVLDDGKHNEKIYLIDKNNPIAFDNFCLTKEALKSEETLGSYIFSIRKQCSYIPRFESINVIAVGFSEELKKEIKLRSTTLYSKSWFGHNIKGRLSTWFKNIGFAQNP